MLKIPAIINNNYFYSIESEGIHSIDGKIIAESSVFPLARLYELKNNITKNFYKMQSIPIKAVLKDLKKAAQVFEKMEFNIDGCRINEERYVGLVSSSTGLPRKLIEREIQEIVHIINNLEDIIAVQVPSGTIDIFDCYRYTIRDCIVGYFPAGKSLTAIIPGNIPTICLYWLISFVQKRPIFLVPPIKEPFTHLLLFEAIRNINPNLSSLITFLPCKDDFIYNLLQISSQIMLPESMAHFVSNSEDLSKKTYFIHHGRSKFVLTEPVKPESIDSICKRMLWNCGRTCTGLTSVIIRGDAVSIAYAISAKLKDIYPDDFSGYYERLPVFNIGHAISINRTINYYLTNGDAVDITEQSRKSPRLVIKGNKSILLPTVLLIQNRKSKIFGLELPFPFITIIKLDKEEEIIECAKNTLILSVASEDRDLIRKLCFENTILKIFSDEHVERGYNYLDPHEGYIADFLNQKKAVFGKNCGGSPNWSI